MSSAVVMENIRKSDRLRKLGDDSPEKKLVVERALKSMVNFYFENDTPPPQLSVVRKINQTIEKSFNEGNQYAD